MVNKFWVQLMHMLFWAAELIRLWAFKQIMKRGTPVQLVALVRKYYGPMFNAMGYQVDVQVAQPSNEASDREGMLRMLEGANEPRR